MTTNLLGLDQKPVPAKIPSFNTTQYNKNSSSFSYSFSPSSPKMQELIAKSEKMRTANIKASE